MRFNYRLLTGILLLAATFSLTAASLPSHLRQADNPTPPDQPVKLIFIHHSTGENWLADGYGDLGQTLGQNNYFVSDTNYGWGPNGIGDRTDIPDWLEWFRSDQTSTYIAALLNENGQHASYTRTLVDPGGENQIILFKSCFPNSALSGNPNDPPGSYGDLSVAGAKYVYNQLLNYFATRPDKLFIVITAPPLSDPTDAANARAFNQWLVHDWLAENGYNGTNVGVFDFYNVLTGTEAHHRYQNGAIEHIPGNQDTLHYPSGDDHPSEAGSQKATQEFIPLLNVYVNRWRRNAEVLQVQPVEPPVELHEEVDPAPETGMEAPPISDLPLAGSGLIDNFEGGVPPGTAGWEPFWDAATSTTMACGPDIEISHQGSTSLRLDFDIAPDSWGTCGLFYDNAQDWRGSQGLLFSFHAADAALILNIDLYVEGPEGTESYLYQYETRPESVDGWVPVALKWDQFHRVDWEAEAGTPFSKPDQVSGMAFGFSTYEATPNTGTIWVDEVQLITVQPETGSGGSSPDVEPVDPAPETGDEAGSQDAPPPPSTTDDEGGGGLPCLGAIALPLGLVGIALNRQRRFLK